MSRGLNNFFVKKRGHRRTGSAKLGRVGEAVFVTFLFGAGLVGLGLLFFGRVLPEWRVNHEFAKNTCVVIDKRVGVTESEGTFLYRPEIEIAYQVGDRRHDIWTYDVWTLENRGGYIADEARVRAIVDHFEINHRYVCWYNPSAPGEAILAKRGPWRDWLAFCIPLSLVLIGGGGLTYHFFTWNKSTERRAAQIKRRGERDVFGRNGKAKVEFPAVPSDDNIIDSPGTKLAYRLPIKSSSGLLNLALVLAAAAWNLVVLRLAIGYFHGVWAGSTHWANLLLLIPLVAFGVWLVLLSCRRIAVLLGIGPTLIEISAHPLLPGRNYRVFVSQTGRLKVQRLQVTLACDEETTFRQGTNTRFESYRVFESVLLEREQFDIGRHQPFETDCAFALPDEAMHSFQGEWNRIAWRIVVRGEADGWPPFERVFPLIVHPLKSSGPENIA